MSLVESSFLADWYEGRADFTVSSNTTLTSLQEIIALDASGGSFELTLTDTTGINTTKRVWLYDSTGDIGTNSVTVKPNGSDGTTIDGESSFTIFVDNAVVILELVNKVWTVMNDSFDVSIVLTSRNTGQVLVSQNTGNILITGAAQ